MKEVVYQWVKNLAVFYILLTVVLHLIPDKKYDRYVRHVMGLLLIVMMSAPVFMLLGKSGKMIESFQMNFNQENKKIIYALGPVEEREAVLIFNEKTKTVPEEVIEYFI